MSRLRKIILILLVVMTAIGSKCYCQVSFTGIVKDNNGEPMAGVIVTVSRGNSTKGFCSTDSYGNFKVTLKETQDSLTGKFSLLGFATKVIAINNLTKHYEVELQPQEFELKEVMVKPAAIRGKGDTIVYNVDMLRGKSDRNIEDVIKRLPGVDVTKEGSILYHGEQISRFYIENLDMLGARYKLATQNISPDDVGSISIYENHVDKRMMKDLTRTDKAAMNISLKKKSMLRPIGYVTGGIGAGEHVNGLGELFTMLVSPKMQYLVTLKGNNAGRSYSQEMTYMSMTGGHRNTEASRYFNSYPYGKPDVDADRFLDNVSTQGSVNTIFKLNDYMTVKVNAGYSYEQNKYRGSKITEYFEGDGSRLAIVENFNARLNEHTPTLTVNVVNNAPKSYFSERVRFNGRFYENLFGVDGTTNVIQRSKNENFTIDNTLETGVRHNSNIINLYSYMSLSRTPLNNLYAISDDGDEEKMIVDQHLSATQFYTKETAGYSYVLSKVSMIGVDGEFTAYYDKFAGHEDVNDKPSNEISGYKLNTTAAMYYQFKNHTVTWRTTATALMNDMSYQDKTDNRRYASHKPYMMFKTSVKWDKGLYFKYNFSVGQNVNTGSISDFILHPVYTTFRNSSIPGTGEFNLTKVYFVNAGTNFKNALYGLFGSLRGNFSLNRRNFLKSTTVDEGLTESMTEVGKNNGISASVMFDISKHIGWLGGKLSLNSSWIYGKNRSMRNGMIFDVRSTIWKINPGFTSSLAHGRLDIVGQSFFTVSSYDYTYSTETRPLLNIRVNGRLSWWILPDLEWRNEVSADRSSVTENEKRTNVYLDTSLRLKLKKFEIEAQGRNLTGRKSFSKINYSDFDVMTGTFGLRGREVLVTVKYSY